MFPEDMIFVDASQMEESEYDEMEKEMNDFSIEGKGYEIGAWNDSGGYEYWHDEGKDGSHNYIQVTVYVDMDKLNDIDPAKLKSDVSKAQNNFEAWGNV